jgi:hypothetical protein
MAILQVAISQRANEYLRRKVPQGRGLGIFVSELVIAEAVKEEIQQTLEAHKGALRDSWDEESNLDAVE